MAPVKKATDSISDEALEQATGHPLRHWLTVLDRFDVAKNGHTLAAKFLADAHGLSPWWSQQVTVTYEQERNLRLPGQRPDGTFTANISKTIGCSVETAYEAWTTVAGWNAWFTKDAILDLRVGGRYSNHDQDSGTFTRIIEPGPLRSMNERARIEFTWENGAHCPRTKVCVQFIEKAENKCTVVVTHDKIADADGLAEMKVGWSWALASLKSFLELGEPISFEIWKSQQE